MRSATLKRGQHQALILFAIAALLLLLAWVLLSTSVALIVSVVILILALAILKENLANNSKELQLKVRPGVYSWSILFGVTLVIVVLMIYVPSMILPGENDLNVFSQDPRTWDIMHWGVAIGGLIMIGFVAWWGLSQFSDTLYWARSGIPQAQGSNVQAMVLETVTDGRVDHLVKEATNRLRANNLGSKADELGKLTSWEAAKSILKLCGRNPEVMSNDLIDQTLEIVLRNGKEFEAAFPEIKTIPDMFAKIKKLVRVCPSDAIREHAYSIIKKHPDPQDPHAGLKALAWAAVQVYKKGSWPSRITVPASFLVSEHLQEISKVLGPGGRGYLGEFEQGVTEYLLHEQNELAIEVRREAKQNNLPIHQVVLERLGLSRPRDTLEQQERFKIEAELVLQIHLWVTTTPKTDGKKKK